jgi:hypothetical protein
VLGVSTLPHSAICILDLGIYPLIRNGGVQNTMGVQFTIQGGSVFNKGVQYTMDVNRPRVQFTMGFKIPYDTGSVNVFFLGETNSYMQFLFIFVKHIVTLFKCIVFVTDDVHIVNIQEHSTWRHMHFREYL